MHVRVTSPTRIPDKPGLKAAIERALARGIAARIRQDTATHDPRDAFAPQPFVEVGPDEGVVRGLGIQHLLFRSHRVGNLRDEFGAGGAPRDGAGGTPFADELVGGGGGELGGRVAVLGEDDGAGGGGAEVGDEPEDVGEGCAGALREEGALHVDDEEGSLHLVWADVWWAAVGSWHWFGCDGGSTV